MNLKRRSSSNSKELISTFPESARHVISDKKYSKHINELLSHIIIETNGRNSYNYCDMDRKGIQNFIKVCYFHNLPLIILRNFAKCTASSTILQCKVGNQLLVRRSICVSNHHKKSKLIIIWQIELDIYCLNVKNGSWTIFLNLHLQNMKFVTQNVTQWQFPFCTG